MGFSDYLWLGHGLMGEATQETRRRSVELLRDLFFRLMNDLEVMTLFELGAHEASASRRFCRSRGDRRAVALEANPHVFARFRERLEAIPGLTYRPQALAPVCGPTVLHIPFPERTLTPLNASLATRIGSSYPAELAVDGHTLECVISGGDGGWTIVEPYAIQADVEGVAFEILSSGVDALSNPDCLLVVVEVEDVALWEGQHTASETFRLLESLGFDAVARDFENPLQYNVIFMKSECTGVGGRSLAQYWKTVFADLAHK